MGRKDPKLQELLSNSPKCHSNDNTEILIVKYFLIFVITIHLIFLPFFILFYFFFFIIYLFMTYYLKIRVYFRILNGHETFQIPDDPMGRKGSKLQELLSNSPKCHSNDNTEKLIVKFMIIFVITIHLIFLPIFILFYFFFLFIICPFKHVIRAVRVFLDF